MSNANDVRTLLRRFEELQKKREEDRLIKEIVEGKVIQVDALCDEKKGPEQKLTEKRQEPKVGKSNRRKKCQTQ